MNQANLSTMQSSASTHQFATARARALAQQWVKHVCDWVETHKATLTPEDHNLWMTVLGVLGGFEATLKEAVQLTPTPGHAQDDVTRQVREVEGHLRDVCADIAEQMGLPKLSFPG